MDIGGLDLHTVPLLSRLLYDLIKHLHDNLIQIGTVT